MKNNKIFLIPVIIFSSVIMLVVYAHPYTLPLSDIAFMAEEDDTVIWDFFSYYKMIFLVMTAAVAAVLLLYGAVTKKLSVKGLKYYIPIGIFGLCVIVSYAFSDYKEFALLGNFDRFEGTLTILCYLFMIVYIINVVKNEADLKIIINSMFVGVFVANIVGLCQILDHDPFMIPNVKTLLGFKDVETIPYSGGIVFQTVYNSNYVSFYLSVMIPLIISFFADKIRNFKSIKKSFRSSLLMIFYGILLTLCLVNFVLCRSEGGYMGLAFSAVTATLIYFIKKGVLKGRRLVAMITGFGAICIVFILIFIKVHPVPYVSRPDIDKRQWISYFETGDNYLKTEIDGNEIVLIKDEKGSFSFYDENDNSINLEATDEPGKYRLLDQRFKEDIFFSPLASESEVYGILEISKTEWIFRFDANEVYYLNPYGNPVKLSKTKHIGFEGNYGLASARGYIWSLTIPVLKHFLFIGNGADTYMFAVDQFDYALKFSAGMDEWNIIDKPHNMYLQMFVNTGLISLLAFLALIGIIITEGYTVIKSGGDNGCLMSECQVRYTSIFLVLLSAFLAAAMVNDSSISVMPLLVTILALSIAVIKN